MKKQKLIALFIFFYIACSFLVLIPNAYALVRSKSETISNFKALCDRHPTVASYESLGKSILNNDIWLFKIGNPDGGHVMWDGQLHGDEDIGTECMYIFATWLLESGDARAAQYLKTNYLLLVPVVNIDTASRQNMRRIYDFGNGTVVTIPSGVNLNRNFPHGWGGSGTSDPTSTSDYRGLYAGSEPETQAIVHAFVTYTPKIYLNSHMWAGPHVYYDSAGNATLISILRTYQDNYFNSVHPAYNGVALTAYPLSSDNAGGYAAYDADHEELGITGLLIEYDPAADPTFRTGNDTTCPLWGIQQYYYPKSLGLILAMMDATAIPYVSSSPPPPPTDYTFVYVMALFSAVAAVVAYYNRYYRYHR